MSMDYWPLEDPIYDQSKSRAENYQYLRSLFEQDFVDKFARYPTMDKYCTGHHLKRILNERYYKGAHTDINYTEALKDLIELGVVKVPITDFDVVFLEWELGNLGDKIKNSQKLEQALFNWDGSTEEDRKKLIQNGMTTLSLIKRDEHMESHKYENFPKEELVQTPFTVQIPPEQVAATYGGNQFVASNTTQPVVQSPVQTQDTTAIPYIENPGVDWANNRKLAEIEAQIAINAERRRLQRAQAHRAQYSTLPQFQGQRYTSPDALINDYIQQEGLVCVGDGVYMKNQGNWYSTQQDSINLVYDSNNPEEITPIQQFDSISSALEGTFIGADES